MISGQEVYSRIGFSASDNSSNSFTNWAAADLAVNGLTVNGFGLFVYELFDTGMDAGQLIGVDLLQPS